MIIIGITGKKRSGKDTVASCIAASTRRLVVRIAFADALKLEVAQAIHKPLQYVEDNKIELRLMLQAWGTDYRRNLCDKNYWIMKYLEAIKNVPDRTELITTPDVRFVNEATVIQQLGGYVIRVVRASDSLADNHASEVEMDTIAADYGIVNDSSLSNLQQQTLNILTNIKNKHSCINPPVQLV